MLVEFTSEGPVTLVVVGCPPEGPDGPVTVGELVGGLFTSLGVELGLVETEVVFVVLSGVLGPLVVPGWVEVVSVVGPPGKPLEGVVGEL